MKETELNNITNTTNNIINQKKGKLKMLRQHNVHS